VSDSFKVTDTLVHGTGNFAWLCSHACTSGAWGRICLRRVGYNGALDFPHFTGFSHSQSDYCGDSNAHYQGKACSDQRRFVIYAR